MKLLTMALLALALFAGCGNRSDQISSINVTYVTSPLNVPSIVERQQGIFEAAFAEFDLPVVYHTLVTGPDQTAALASGHIQFLFAVGGTSVIQAAVAGLDIRIISIFSRAPEAFMLFSRDASIASAADLAGRTIAGPAGTILHQMLVAYLNTAGLTMSDVHFLPMDIAESQAALAAGAVDMALLAGAAAFNTEQGGAHMVTNGVGLVEATIVVAVTQRFYNEHRQLVERFRAAHHEVVDFIANNQRESMEMTAAVTGLPLYAVEAMFPMYDFSAQILPSDIQSLEDSMHFMLANGMIEYAIDIESIILR